MTTIFGALGVSPTLRGQPTNVFNLRPSETWVIPAGTWGVQCGQSSNAPSPTYSNVQQYDSLQGTWRNVGAPVDGFTYVNSDGVNYRIANQTGCVVGALLTNAGSAYTSAPTVTDNGGGSTVYQAILGPVVATSVTVTTGGRNYTYPPIVMISAPGAPGVQATGYATISAGVVTAVTITDQGAGYSSVPTISLLNDPRDTTGTGAAATCTTTGSGTVGAVVVTDHGGVITSSSVLPTLTFAGGGGTGAAATAIVCTCITGFVVSVTGSGYSGTVEISALGGFPSTTPAYTNPKVQSQLVRARKASILSALSGTQISSSGATYLDGGIYAGYSPTPIIYGSVIGAGTLSVGVVTLLMGGNAETVSIYAV